MDKQFIPGRPFPTDSRFWSKIAAGALDQPRGNGLSAPQRSQPYTPADVKNASGADIEAFEPLAIDGFVFDVDENEPDTIHDWTLKGVKPSKTKYRHKRSIAIALEPCGDGDVRSFATSGLTLAKIESGRERPRAWLNDDGKLIGTNHSGFPILSDDNGAGLALIRLDWTPAPTVRYVVPAPSSGNDRQIDGGGSTTCDVLASSDGSIGTDQTIEVDNWTTEAVNETASHKGHATPMDDGKWEINAEDRVCEEEEPA